MATFSTTKANEASKVRSKLYGPCCPLMWAGAGLRHAAPLHRGVEDTPLCAWRAQQDRLLHVGAQTGHGEDVQQTDGRVQGQTDGDEVGVEAQGVTCGERASLE